MSEPILELGANGELDEDANGDIILRNTATGTTLTLSDDIVELVAAIADHTATDVHTEPQPPEAHDNTAHSETYAVDGDPQPPEAHDHTGDSLTPTSVTAETAEISTGATLVPEDLTVRDGAQSGEYATHDGSGNPSAGLYRWDGVEWVSVEDSSAI